MCHESTGSRVFEESDKISPCSSTRPAIFEPNSLLWSVALLQAVCGILSAVGWRLGLKLQVLVPALLAAGAVGAAASVAPQLTGNGGRGRPLWQLLEHALSQLSIRFMCCVAILSVFSIFAVVHWYRAWLAAELDGDPPREAPFETEFRRWCREDRSTEERDRTL